LAKKEKKKNNHFVPRSYLVRFRSASDKQVGLYNLKSGLIVETAPIKSQCSRDYFYTKNPIFESQFAKIEGLHKQLLKKIVDEAYVPQLETPDHHTLLALIMFQAGRTATTAAHQDHLANQFGKAIMRKSFERDGNKEMLEYLDRVNISMPDGVIDAIGQHLAMYPLIGDLEVTPFENHSKEDFLTSDHPVALCNNLPAQSSPFGANVGFASRGLLILLPLSPHYLFLLSDPEVYKAAKDGRQIAAVTKVRDAVELNLAQCFNAHENLYFASAARVQETLATFNKRRQSLRLGPASLTEIPAFTPSGRTGVVLTMPALNRRMVLPNAVEIRRAARTGKYKLGDAFVRDPIRTAVVNAELNRLQKLREEATKAAETQEQASASAENAV
jgi:Protein of unknown function (DUF4238)